MKDMTITLKMVKDGLKKNLINPSMDDVGLTCHIGDNWFFFGGSEFELTEPKDIPIATQAKMIKSTLDAFKLYDDTIDEYLYYFFYLKERL